MSDNPLQKQTDEVPPDLFKHLLENQSEDLALRREELELRKHEMQCNHEFSIQALEAQRVDVAAERKSFGGMFKIVAGVIVVVVLALVSFFCYALFLGKEVVVIEALKAVVYVLTGGLGGFSLGQAKRDKKPSFSEGE